MIRKRLFDIAFAFLALVLLSPLLLLIALLVKLTSRGPVLFKQRRVGLNGKEFTILKFRTMRDGSGRPGIDLTSRDDPRITRIGRFLRRHHLDELPQFWNVFKGEMSVVGPRPYEIQQTIDFQRYAPHAVLRQRVKPGITGLAQVKGRTGKTLPDLNRDLTLDLEYVQRPSLGLDVLICLRTILIMCESKGI